MTVDMQRKSAQSTPYLKKIYTCSAKNIFLFKNKNTISKFLRFLTHTHTYTHTHIYIYIYIYIYI